MLDLWSQRETHCREAAKWHQLLLCHSMPGRVLPLCTHRIPPHPWSLNSIEYLHPGVNRIINYIFFPGVYWRSCKTLLQILDKKIFQYCKNAAVFCGTWSDISFLFLRDLGMPGVWAVIWLRLLLIPLLPNTFQEQRVFKTEVASIGLWNKALTGEIKKEKQDWTISGYKVWSCLVSYNLRNWCCSSATLTMREAMSL